jgi:hypothetical protein
MSPLESGENAHADVEEAWRAQLMRYYVAKGRYGDAKQHETPANSPSRTEEERRQLSTNYLVGCELHDEFPVVLLDKKLPLVPRPAASSSGREPCTRASICSHAVTTT